MSRQARRQRLGKTGGRVLARQEAAFWWYGRQGEHFAQRYTWPGGRKKSSPSKLRCTVSLSPGRYDVTALPAMSVTRMTRSLCTGTAPMIKGPAISIGRSQGIAVAKAFAADGVPRRAKASILLPQKSAGLKQSTANLIGGGRPVQMKEDFGTKKGATWNLCLTKCLRAY